MDTTVKDIFDNTKIIKLSMGEDPVSIAKYLNKNRGMKAIVYGAGNYGRICVKMIKDRTDIEIYKIVDKKPPTYSTIEGIDIINRNELVESEYIAFVAVKKYCSDDEVKSEIDNYLKEKGAQIIINMMLTIERMESKFYSYFLNHENDFISAYKYFDEPLSKETFCDYLKCILSGEIYKGIQFDEKYKYWGGESSLFSLSEEVIVNCGSYFGDTIFEWFACDLSIKKIYAIEADFFTYKTLCKNLNYLSKGDKNKVETVNAFVGVDEFEEKIDIIVKEDKVTLINMDIEGAELSALKSAESTIKRDHPVLAICVYHKPEDLIVIPQYIHALYNGYRFYLRKYLSTGGTHWGGRNQQNELVLYAVPVDRIL